MHHDVRGASAVEFALVLPVLLLLLFGILQFGVTLAALQGLEAATREGARLAALGRDVGAAEVTAAVRDATPPFIDPDAIAVTINGGSGGGWCPASVADGAEVTVTVTARVAGSAYGIELLGGVGIDNPPLEAVGVFRCEAPHGAG